MKLKDDKRRQIIKGKEGKDYPFSETADNRDFTVCIIRCVYRAEFILGVLGDSLLIE